MDTDDMRFFIKNEDGTETECAVLFTFDNDERGKSYVVYTDGSFNEEGKIQVYASIYNPNKGYQRLIPIKSKEEWADIEEAIERIKNGEFSSDL